MVSTYRGTELIKDVFVLALPPDHHTFHHGAVIDRCKGIEFDAVAVNEIGVPYFFKGDHLFKGFHGEAELSNETFAELDDHHHLGHVDAAFRMHSVDSPEHHDHQFFFLDDKVFSYYKHKLEVGYPKEISEAFPGIPDHLDAAVECPKPDCPEDTVIFFKDDEIFHYDIKSKKVDEKEFKDMPNCTAAFRYMEHYYCLHGHQFSKFDPITGEVHGRYPKEIRDYFMRCSHFGEKSIEDHIDRERCTRVHLDAITEEDDGDIYAFRGHHFLSVSGDKFHSNTIESAFKELHSEVDAVFSYEGHLYMIKDDQVYVYKVGEPHTHLEGYPKPLKEELGIEGPVDAAFVCVDHHIAHIIKGQTVYDVDLNATPRVPVREGTMSAFKKKYLICTMSPRNSKTVEELANSLNSHYEDKVRPCIDLVDNLRSLGVEKDLSLPAIAVIGDQSSGKSSVLEALSGVALPRGTGIVTRCPLVLKLKRVEAGVAWSGRLYYKDIVQTVLKPDDVGHAVANAQNNLAGKGKGISKEMITLDIESSKVPDLTLIDLPGIARVATDGQPFDIEKQIKDLIEKFIKRQETISLVVVPANIDIATTEALKMANKVDPFGERTLGILTKPDLVDKGAEETVVSTVCNQVIPLKKGYMMVKCRGQQDINSNLSLAKALQNERDFFEQSAHFRPLLEERKATVPFLAERLTKELVEHIARSLPQLQKQIEQKSERTAKKLRKLGDGVPIEDNERNNFLIKKINNFNQVLTDVIRAEEDTKNDDSKVFTKIRTEFGKWKSHLDKKSTTLEENLRDEVEEYTRIRRGKELPGFVNYRTFENIVKKHVTELEEPAIQLLTDITGIVHACLNDIASDHFEAFPNLLKAAKEPIEDFREQEYENAKERVKAQFKMEKIVYSQDGLYSWKLESVKKRPELAKFVMRPISADVREMSQHLNAYFTITTERLANQVPLIIQYHVLHQYISQLQTAMLALIGGKNAEKLIQEDLEVAHSRKLLKESLDRLRKARQVLSKFVRSAS
ncbi:hypothetical protein NFI96_000667 [Prochilodus magdalenae]|nr:hypothetical protein NFI96_000667 [Prochilodus magdalenae]